MRIAEVEGAAVIEEASELWEPKETNVHTTAAAIKVAYAKVQGRCRVGECWEERPSNSRRMASCIGAQNSGG